MPLERAHVGRKQAEANGAAAVAVVDAVDQRRQFLAPVAVGREQVRLVLGCRHQVEQHHADAEWFGARNPLIAGAIIRQRTGHFDPSTYRDRYQEALQQLIEAKTKGLTIKPRAVSTPSPVIDLMAALKRSLA
jgi:hypothetical protein